MIVGLDASRNRSGGALTHIVGILEHFDESLLSLISEVHVWSYPALLDQIPDRKWLRKHSSKKLSGSIFQQLAWQRYSLPREIAKEGIDILLNTDAGTVCSFQPSVTISRDLLSYEKDEFDRYSFGLFKLRLVVLRCVQNHSLMSSSGVIFLTDYAHKKIEEYIGDVEEFAIIPHGVGSNFRISSLVRKRASLNDGQPIRCVYVSNIERYKHQCEVACAIAILKSKGYNIRCDFIGSVTSPYYHQLQTTLHSIKNSNQFITVIGAVKHEEIVARLMDKDIFIFASGCENMPNILIEGMCTGLPIACSNRGPMPSILLDGGVYFDPNDSSSIAMCLQQIIDDDKLRLGIADKSVALSERYNWDRCSAETFEYLYRIASVEKSKNVGR